MDQLVKEGQEQEQQAWQSRQPPQKAWTESKQKTSLGNHAKSPFGMPSKKRPAPAGKAPGLRAGLRKERKKDDLDWKAPVDDEITSSEEDSGSDAGGRAGRKLGRRGSQDGSSSDVSIEETAEEKRMRLAREYITKIRSDVGPGEDTEEAVTARLRDDVLAARGDMHAAVAKQLCGVTFDSSSVKLSRAHRVRAVLV
jgi:ribosomal RNA-processing protein 9